jgi:hypothetical protein
MRPVFVSLPMDDMLVELNDAQTAKITAVRDGAGTDAT